MESGTEMNLTERDLSVLSRKMPPDKWRFILRECLDISEADISRAEYSCRGEAVQAVIFKALHTWMEGESPPLNRLDMYHKLDQARTHGICQTNNWYQFLLPDHFQLDTPHQGSINSAQHMENGIMQRKGILLWILSKPLEINFMISALILHLYFTCTTWYIEEECETPLGYFQRFLFDFYFWLSAIFFGGSSLHILPDYVHSHSRSIGMLCCSFNIFLLGNCPLSHLTIMTCLLITNMATIEKTEYIIKISSVFNMLCSSMIGSHIAHVILHTFQHMEWNSVPFSFFIICEMLNVLIWLMSGAHLINFIQDCRAHSKDISLIFSCLLEGIKKETYITRCFLIMLFISMLVIWFELAMSDALIANVNYLQYIACDCITLTMLLTYKSLGFISHQTGHVFHEKTTLAFMLILNGCFLTLVNGHYSRTDFLYYFPGMLIYPSQPFLLCLLI